MKDSYTPSPEEFEKAEGMMEPEEAKQSAERYKSWAVDFLPEIEKALEDERKRQAENERLKQKFPGITIIDDNPELLGELERLVERLNNVLKES